MKRRVVLGMLCGGMGVVAAGCSLPQPTRSLSLGLVRAVNLDESSIDVRLSLSPTGDETAAQSSQTLHGFNRDGNSRADELVDRPESPRVVSDYEYSLAVNDESVMSVDGREVVSNYAGEYDAESCLVVHYYIDEMENDISYSTELYDECDLPN